MDMGVNEKMMWKKTMDSVVVSRELCIEVLGPSTLCELPQGFKEGAVHTASGISLHNLRIPLSSHFLPQECQVLT